MQSGLEDRLSSLLADTELHLNSVQISKCVKFVLLMAKWNNAYNLSSVREPQDMLVKHILDSIVVSTHINAHNIADVGTGPGLPGIPLAITHPQRQFTLIDSLGKRIRFIKQVIYELELTNVKVEHVRVEAFQPDNLFDCIISRAFASLTDMISWCEHLLTREGYFLALKGQLHTDELNAIPKHFSVAQCTRLLVPSLEGERHLVKLTRNLPKNDDR